MTLLKVRRIYKNNYEILLKIINKKHPPVWVEERPTYLTTRLNATKMFILPVS